MEFRKAVATGGSGALCANAIVILIFSSTSGEPIEFVFGQSTDLIVIRYAVVYRQPAVYLFLKYMFIVLLLCTYTCSAPSIYNPFVKVAFILLCTISLRLRYSFHRSDMFFLIHNQNKLLYFEKVLVFCSNLKYNSTSMVYAFFIRFIMYIINNIIIL